MQLAVNAIAHFLVDALCLATMFSGRIPTESFFLALLLYNTLAFSTQCIVGLAVDKARNVPLLEMIALVTVAGGFAISSPWWLSVILIGCGNSLFHVTGGCVTLRRSNGKAWPLGVFVAPGAIGVTVGTLFPKVGWVLAAALLLCAAAIWACARVSGSGTDTPSLAQTVLSSHGQSTGLSGSCGTRREDMSVPLQLPILAIVLLIIAVAVRAIGGSAVSFPWKTGMLAAFAMTICVFAGKTVGGFVCDRVGPRAAAWISIPAAAILIAFFSHLAAPALLGQFLLNLTMPVTLWMLFRLLPDDPAFAFGLAASALWPGTIAGALFTLTGPALWACVIVSFLFGLVAILYGASKLPGGAVSSQKQ